MRCEDVERSLPELIEEELPLSQRTEVLTHLQGCPACADARSAYHDLLALVRADQVPEPPVGFWEAFRSSLKHRIAQDARKRKSASIAWLAGLGFWVVGRPRVIAGLAVAAATIVVAIRSPSLLPMTADHRTVPIATEKVVDQYGGDRRAVRVPRSEKGNQPHGELLVVAGEIVEEPAILIAAIQRLHWVDEIADPLETAWVLRQETDPVDSLASLDEKEQQTVLDHLRHFKWSES